MNRMLERRTGLDVHKRSVVATARIPDGAGACQVITHTFGTTTADLLGLRDWLESPAVTQVAMESTAGFTGSRSSMCWRMGSPCCSSTPNT